MYRWLAAPALLAPAAALAAPRTFAELLGIFVDLLNVAVFVIMSAALLFFVWGIAEFIRKADSEEGRREGRRHILWGVVILFAMASLWGILRVLDNTFFSEGVPFTRANNPQHLVYSGAEGAVALE